MGVAYLDSDNILNFELNIPRKIQHQGLGSVIFRQAIEDYSPNKIKGWWLKKDFYSGGESVNLTIFKKKIMEGLSETEAALATPTGKLAKSNGFGGIPLIIKNTSDEVIIHFLKK